MSRLGRLRPSMQRFHEDSIVDCVVIGTGAGGAPVMRELARAGRSVVALEAGPWWDDPAAQFATDERAASKLYWNDERLTDGDGPIAMGGNNSGTGVGGSTLHWGAFVPRADARDLQLHTLQDVAVDWPLKTKELTPFYEEAEAALGVSGPAHYPWDPARRYPLGPIPVNAPGELMQRGFATLGLLTAEAPIAALSEARGERGVCVNRGYCHQGCRNGAKASMDVTFLPDAVEAGAEIRSEAFVYNFTCDSAGHIEAVHYRDAEGNEHTQRTRAVYLCAGGVETPRLLLHTGLANRSAQVGRNFMAHVATQVWGTFRDHVGMNRGFPATIISEDLLRPENASFAGGYLVQSLGVVPVTWANSVARGRGLFGADLQRYLENYNYVAGIGINGDCLPSPHNFIELSDELDARGLPKPIVHFSYGANELAMSQHAADLLTDAWQRAGASDCWTLQRSAHTIGTARMGDDPDSSVVGPYGQSHDIPNLWISDNSTFPTALAANPALTIIALALRSARQFLADH